MTHPGFKGVVLRVRVHHVACNLLRLLQDLLVQRAGRHETLQEVHRSASEIGFFGELWLVAVRGREQSHCC